MGKPLRKNQARGIAVHEGGGFMRGWSKLLLTVTAGSELTGLLLLATQEVLYIPTTPTHK